MNNKQELISDLHNLGVKSGDVLLVHTSIKGLQNKTGDATPYEVIEALIETVGASGTLLVPALSYSVVTVDNPVFDVNSTITCIGTVPEIFRKEFAEYRSIHPTHSVCAVGKYAREITVNHQLDNTPVGVNSPFRKLTDSNVNGKILMLGCGLKPNTFMHGVEECAGASYVLSKEMMEYVINDGCNEYRKKYYTHSFGELIQRYDRLERIMSDKGLIKGKVLNGTAYLIDAIKAMQIGIEQIKKEDVFFIDKP